MEFEIMIYINIPLNYLIKKMYDSILENKIYTLLKWDKVSNLSRYFLIIIIYLEISNEEINKQRHDALRISPAEEFLNNLNFSQQIPPDIQK